MSEIIKNIIISNSIFSKNTTHTTIEGFFSSLKGLANKIEFQNSIKSSLGEFSERYTELTSAKDTKKVATFNVITNKISFIDSSQVYLLRKNITTIKNSDFFDSSGTAFFTNTDQAIRKAFFEFVERQSLVYSFLREWPGKRINSKLIKKELSSYSNSSFETIMMNDISVLNGVHVILFVGISPNSYNVGLGTDFSLNQAIKNALDEGIGIKEFEISDKDILYREKKIKYLDEQLKDGNIPISSYDSIFFNRLTPTFVYQRFKYLLKAENVILENKADVSDKIPTITRIKNECKNWKLEPCISFLNSISLNVEGYVIHISAQGAYPHIFTPLLDPKKYSASYMLDSSDTFPNKYKYLPFP